MQAGKAISDGRGTQRIKIRVSYRPGITGGEVTGISGSFLNILKAYPQSYIIRMIGERTRGIRLKQGILQVKGIHGRVMS
jgi:hypothetical protein